MSEYETRVEEKPIIMVGPLGTDPILAARLKHDNVKFTYLVSSDKLPNQFKPMLYRLVREDVVIHKKRFDEALNDNMLRLLNAIYGRGQENLIRAELAIKGSYVPMEQQPEKPSLMDRLLGRENVQEYERWKERQELGLE